MVAPTQIVNLVQRLPDSDRTGPRPYRSHRAMPFSSRLAGVDPALKSLITGGVRQEALPVYGLKSPDGRGLLSL